MIRLYGDFSLNMWVYFKDKYKIYYNDLIKLMIIYVERERGLFVYFCYLFIDGDVK